MEVAPHTGQGAMGGGVFVSTESHPWIRGLLAEKQTLLLPACVEPESDVPQP